MIDNILADHRVWQLAFSPDQKYLSTTNGNSNDVKATGLDKQETIKPVQVGQQPWGVVVAPG